MATYKKGMTVADLLNAACRERGLNGTELGRELGVSQATGSRWLSGKDTPEDRRAPRLAEFVGVPVEHVIQAMHDQRTGPTVGERIAALEERIDAMAAQIEQLARRRR